MTGYTITQVEDAIINTIIGSTQMDYVRTVERLPLENRKLAQKLILRYPAVLVIYTGGTDQSIVYSELDHRARFSIWCADKNVKKVSAASVGVYQMLNDLLDVLHNSNLGLENVQDCISTGTSFIDADEKMTIFSRDFDIIWKYQ